MMLLKSIQITENAEHPHSWSVDTLELQNTNLIVGSNSSGKSKVISYIWTLAKLISNSMKFTLFSGDCHATFADGSDTISYTLKYRDSKIIEEKFEKNSEVLMHREAGGFGKIYTESEKKSLSFQTPDSELAVVARKDSSQHAFFEPLHAWAKSVYFYDFGSPLGKQNLVVFVDQKIELDVRNCENVVGIFARGFKNHGKSYVDAIIADMAVLGYFIESIGLAPPTNLIITGFPGTLVCLSVKERDLTDYTGQLDMSRGMFRALSLLVQLNYLKLEGLSAGTIIIDDIGEGLDFNRSCDLIELLMQKTSSSGEQLIMSTNDRFVMNKVPLKAWTILQRSGNAIKPFNYANSTAKFDEFRFTGLNNFDFFAMDFLNGDVEPQDGEGIVHEAIGGIR
jgi:energy-coupling factor transporter ATP-binding protein EcfA2